MARQEQAQPAISTADTGTAEQGLAPGAAQSSHAISEAESAPIGD